MASSKEYLQVNKIAARWPAKAVAQFFFIKKAVELLSIIRYC